MKILNLLELKQVSFSYGQELVLKELDMSIESGDFVAIIGANGSGKSTLAKLFNVLLQPTSGKVLIAGLDTGKEENMWEIRKKVGMVFQNPDNQLVATLVEDDVAFGLENLGLPTAEIKMRVKQSLKIVGMDGFEHHAPHRLSGGQKQRVAIAGIIAMEPDCIVLDEPTAMLDPKGRKEVLETINYLNKEKKITIIYITHFMEEIMEAKQVFILQEGEIFKQGKPSQIFRDIEEIKKINLDVPVIIELATALRQKGLTLPVTFSVDSLVNSLIKLI